MKKLILCAFLLISFVGLNGQNQDPTKVYRPNKAHFGIVGGMQVSSFYDESAGDPNFQAGYQLGFTYQMPILKWISLEPQILYSRKGGEFDGISSSNYNRTINYRLHYLEAPITLNIRPNRVLQLELGAYGGYLIDATYAIDMYYGKGVGELDYGDFEEYDYGLTGGLGFNVGPCKFSVRYSQGLRNVLKNAEKYPDLEGAKNNAVTFSFTGYF